MIINKLYQTKITSSNYNIDLNGTVTITVTLTDFNNAVITGESVSISANVGSFSSNTGTTNSSGQVTFTYTASTAGLVNITCNSESIQLLVAHNPYPIGSIYMSVNSTSPATLFGGTWTQLTNTFLYASTTADTSATTATAGSKDAVVVSHNHRADMVGMFVKGQSNAWDFTIDSAWNSVGNGGQYEDYGQGHIITKNSGESGTDKNMPPYMKVYMWKRTA